MARPHRLWLTIGDVAAAACLCTRYCLVQVRHESHGSITLHVFALFNPTTGQLQFAGC